MERLHSSTRKVSSAWQSASHHMPYLWTRWLIARSTEWIQSPESREQAEVLVNGEIRTQLSGSTAFGTEQVPLAPGPHTITWSYKTNPAGTEVFAPVPVPVGRVGAAGLVLHDDMMV